MLAAIEIYNKPQFNYREEVFSILLVNAWELLLLSTLSKHKERIFKPKKRGQDYQTWRISESISHAKAFFPTTLDHNAIKENLSLIKEYRNNAVHYYNTEETDHCMYVLAQAAIKNYRDLVNTIFKQDLVNQINLVLLPLSFSDQPDFVEFFRGVDEQERSPFVQRLFKVMETLEGEAADTSRLITQCTVKLESIKKIQSADFSVAVDNHNAGGTVIIAPPRDPNKSHPFGRTELIGKLRSAGKNIKPGEFEAICWKYDLKNFEKNQHKYAWKLDGPGNSWRFTSETLKFIKALEANDIKLVKDEHKQYRSASKNT